VDSVEVVKVATPPVSVPVPRVVAPSRNVTDPVGEPPAPVTVAVNVTDWPTSDGFTEEASAVVLAPRTAWEIALEVLVAKFASPAYFAVIECVPAVSVDVANVATPELRVPDPRVVAPSRNVTVPVGVPPVTVTVAVNVTDWPVVDGLTDEASTVVLALPLTTCVTTEDVLPAKLVSPP